MTVLSFSSFQRALTSKMSMMLLTISSLRSRYASFRCSPRSLCSRVLCYVKHCLFLLQQLFIHYTPFTLQSCYHGLPVLWFSCCSLCSFQQECLIRDDATVTIVKRALEKMALDSSSDEEVPDLPEPRQDDKWDCESIISTRTNTENRPKLVVEPPKGGLLFNVRLLMYDMSCGMSDQVHHCRHSKIP